MPALDLLGTPGSGRGPLRTILTAPFRYLNDRRDAARVRRSVTVTNIALDWAVLHGTSDLSAVGAILRSAGRDAAVLRLTESRLVHRTFADTRARDALALVQLALDELPPQLGA